MTAHTNDEAFHEIQLNGKQLVFLFMSATVVSVVIFLLGVLVGRNVRVQRTAIAQAEAMAQSPAPDLQASPVAVVSQPAVDPTIVPPPPTVDDSAAEKEKVIDPQQAQAEAEALKPAAPRTVPGATSTSGVVSQPERKVPPAKVPPAKASVAEPAKADSGAAGSGFAVQVAALNVRGEADAIAKRLTTKGYAAYVQMPTTGTANVYRVRVGTFKTRREAETVASKLQKEEQFKPWVTR